MCWTNALHATHSLIQRWIMDFPGFGSSSASVQNSRGGSGGGGGSVLSPRSTGLGWVPEHGRCTAWGMSQAYEGNLGHSFPVCSGAWSCPTWLGSAQIPNWEGKRTGLAGRGGFGFCFVCTLSGGECGNASIGLIPWVKEQYAYSSALKIK